MDSGKRRPQKSRRSDTRQRNDTQQRDDARRRNDTRHINYDYWEPLGIDSKNEEDQAAVVKLIHQAYAPVLNFYLDDGGMEDAKHLFKSPFRSKEFQEGCISRIHQLPRYVRAHVPNKDLLVDLLYDILRHIRQTDDTWIHRMDGPPAISTPVLAPKNPRIRRVQDDESTNIQETETPVMIPITPERAPEPDVLTHVNVQSRPGPGPGPEQVPELEYRSYPRIPLEPQAQPEYLLQTSPRSPRPLRPIRGTLEWVAEYRKKLIPLRFYNRGTEYDLLDQDWVVDSDPNDADYGFRDPILGPVFGHPEEPKYAEHPWEKHP
ncbi:uncharacterized protein N7529_008582 [Penicillium soppii]|uniref:uncharacterized protein n=1 Tax=Penicillium soppii TaxID=69789 RepID=UPI00254737B0|nr:uncharacterized protein N7529_008582 [Penicillium soppii]KAJ5861272.1 hypothetical protein N7529_008582 [Penicillium soppii]